MGLRGQGLVIVIVDQVFDIFTRHYDGNMIGFLRRHMECGKLELQTSRDGARERYLPEIRNTK
jgi:hypothetical protein